jgi:hypothetical protein
MSYNLIRNTIERNTMNIFKFDLYDLFFLTLIIVFSIYIMF